MKFIPPNEIHHNLQIPYIYCERYREFQVLKDIVKDTFIVKEKYHKKKS